MPTPLLQAYPLRSGATRAQVIEDLLDLSKSGKQDAVDQVIDMLEDLYKKGRGCR